MVSASSILLLRLMDTGEYVNLWGGYLNTALQTIERASKGYQALAVTGDATISWTQYSASNTGAVALLKLTGSLAVAAALTFPAYHNFILVWNSAGATVTLKCSGGTGVAIPNNRRALIFCDGVDYYFAGPDYIGNDITEANNRDLVDYAALQAAIAAISTAQNGLVLNSSTATESEYFEDVLTVSGPVTKSKTGGGTAAEATNLAVAYLGLTAGARKTTSFTATPNTKYPVALSAAATITLPPAPADEDLVMFSIYGEQDVTLDANGNTVNGLSTLVLPGFAGVLIIHYDDTLGDWT